MSDVSELSKTALARRYESMRGALRRVREDTKHAGKLLVGTSLTAVGGALAGYASTNSSLATIPGTTLPTDATLGSALLLGCALDMFDNQNDNIACLAAGMVAAAAYRETQKAALARLGTR